jgi:hypothetical protein
LNKKKWLKTAAGKLFNFPSIILAVTFVKRSVPEFIRIDVFWSIRVVVNTKKPIYQHSMIKIHVCLKIKGMKYGGKRRESLEKN